MLLVRGPEEGVTLAARARGGPADARAAGRGRPPLSELDRAVDMLVELKDLSEAAVGLAYSSILFNNRVARGARSARSRRGATSCTTSSSPGCFARPRRRATWTSCGGCCASASASESMCDAARDMTWYVEQGEPLHPVVQLALEETEETSAETVVERRLPGRRAVAEGAPARDRDRHVRPRGPARPAVDLPAARDVLAAGRGPAHRRRSRGGRRGARAPLCADPRRRAAG